MRKVLVLTGYTETIEYKGYGKCDFGELAAEVNREWAKAHGYDFECVVVPHATRNRDMWPTWIKIELILEALGEYDYVCWIDADAIFVGDDSLDNFFGKDIALTKDLPHKDAPNTLTTTNTGLMVVKNSGASFAILENLLAQSGKWENGKYMKSGWHEQGLLNEMYVRPQLIATRKFGDYDYWRLVNNSAEDITKPFETENFRIMPQKYNSNNIDKIELVYHATGYMDMKLERLDIAREYKKEIPVNTTKDLVNINFIKQPKVTIDSQNDDDFKVEFIDPRTGQVVHQDTIGNHMWVAANRSWYTPWHIKVYSSAGLTEYDMDLNGQKVLISFDSKSLGDTIAWMPYVEEFRKKHNCRVVCSSFWNRLFDYPEIEFVEPGAIVRDIYAQFELGWWFDPNRNPNDVREIPLQQTASDILGLEYREIRPKMKPGTPYSPKVGNVKKYVCLAIQSTAQAKYWNHPGGWDKVIKYLGTKGYTVVVVDKDRYFGTPEMMNSVKPATNVRFMTGEGIPIEDVIGVIERSEMFLGISSGLSWLAWAMGTPVVMVSGFTDPVLEFTTGIKRIINTEVCHGCFTDRNIDFDKSNWMWCPRNKGFECTKRILPEDVIKEIGLE